MIYSYRMTFITCAINNIIIDVIIVTDNSILN